MTELVIDYDRDGHKITVENVEKPVSVTIGDEEIASTSSALLLKEIGHPPVYYVPLEDVKSGILEKTDTTTNCPFKGNAMYYTIKLGTKEYRDAVWRYLDSIREFDRIRDYVAFYSNVASVAEVQE